MELCFCKRNCDEVFKNRELLADRNYGTSVIALVVPLSLCKNFRKKKILWKDREQTLLKLRHQV